MGLFLSTVEVNYSHYTAMFLYYHNTEKYNFFCLSFNQIQYLDSFISGAQVKFVLCTHFGQNDYLPTYKLKTVSMSTSTMKISRMKMIAIYKKNTFSHIYFNFFKDNDTQEII